MKILTSFLLVLVFFSNTSQASPLSVQEGLVMLGDQVNSNLVQQTIQKTDRIWDLAIQGSGFFPLKDSKTGESVYTRYGRFEMDRNGYVVLSGHPSLQLMMQVGERVEPVYLLEFANLNGKDLAGLSFDIDDVVGTLDAIYSNGESQSVARVILATFFNKEKLIAIAPHIYKTDAASLPVLMAPPREKGLGNVVSRSLEQL